MFANLMESGSRKPRQRRGGVVLSFIVHYGLVLGVVYTSAQAAQPDNEGPREEQVEFLVKPKPVEQPELPEPELIAAPQVPKASPILLAPFEIPTTLPEIDLTQRVTDPDDFIARARGTNDTTRPAGSNTAPEKTEYFRFEVEKPVTMAPNSASPVYPDILRKAGVEGEALVAFVVDTAGRVDLASFKVVRASHDLFATAVKNALPRMRFVPAEIGARKVRQHVQQPFSFAIAK